MDENKKQNLNDEKMYFYRSTNDRFLWILAQSWHHVAPVIWGCIFLTVGPAEGCLSVCGCTWRSKPSCFLLCSVIAHLLQEKKNNLWHAYLPLLYLHVADWIRNLQFITSATSQKFSGSYWRTQLQSKNDRKTVILRKMDFWLHFLRHQTIYL